eukprot:1725881-Lingulodinium_polyedra.AAC.1
MSPKKSCRRVSNAKLEAVESRLAEEEQRRENKCLLEECITLLKVKDRSTLLAVKRILTGDPKLAPDKAFPR